MMDWETWVAQLRNEMVRTSHPYLVRGLDGYRSDYESGLGPLEAIKQDLSIKTLG